VPDADQLPRWADAVEAFVDGLIEAGFGRRLREIMLADAVRDDGLRARLRHAEQMLDGAEAVGAFSGACLAFEEARSRWRQQRTGLAAGFRHSGVTAALDPLASVQSQINALEEALDVQPFAADPSEYVWLRTARLQQDQGWTPESGDARRALLFAIGWIVRWEVFDRGYPVERWNEYWDRIEPPIVDDGPPRILHAETVAVGGQPGIPPRLLMLLDLANVPERGRGGWGSDLSQVLVDAAHELGYDVRFESIRLHVSGRLTIMVSPDADADAVADVIERALVVAHARYGERLTHAAERESALQALERDVNALFAEAVSSSDLFGLATVEARLAVPAREIVYVEVQTEGHLEDLAECAATFRDVGGVLSSASYENERLAIDVFELSDTNRDLVKEAIRRCEENILARRERRARESEDFRRFAGRLKERLGPGQATASSKPPRAEDGIRAPE
jgi:hypothetical protein